VDTKYYGKNEVLAKALEAVSDNTEEKQSNLKPWKKGVSGNPSGRPKGSKSKIATAYIEALHDDFSEHKDEAIARLRKDDLPTYMKLVAQLLPKEFEISVNVNHYADFETAVEASNFAESWKIVRRAMTMIGAGELPIIDLPAEAVVEVETANG
jgi:Family of unknown function (DUF5681)